MNILFDFEVILIYNEFGEVDFIVEIMVFEDVFERIGFEVGEFFSDNI